MAPASGLEADIRQIFETFSPLHGQVPTSFFSLYQAACVTIRRGEFHSGSNGQCSMKNAEPARDIVRRNNSIRDLAWDRLTRDVGRERERERGDRMRKIKKGEEGDRGREREREEKWKATKREIKRAGTFFGKSSENPSGQLNSIQWRFVPLLRGLPIRRKCYLYSTCHLPFFPSSPPFPSLVLCAARI